MTNREAALALLAELGSVSPEWSDEHQAEIHEERHVTTVKSALDAAKRSGKIEALEWVLNLAKRETEREGRTPMLEMATRELARLRAEESK